MGSVSRRFKRNICERRTGYRSLTTARFWRRLGEDVEAVKAAKSAQADKDRRESGNFFARFRGFGRRIIRRGVR